MCALPSVRGESSRKKSPFCCREDKWRSQLELALTSSLSTVGNTRAEQSSADSTQYSLFLGLEQLAAKRAV